MPTQLTVLASGSSGNASLLETHGFGLLIDAGLGPKQLANRLHAAGRTWNDIHALVLTHTHCDHWSQRTLTKAAERRLPIYMHAAHVEHLRRLCPAINHFNAVKSLRTYDEGQWFTLGDGLRCLPAAVPHDGGPTFGFRFEQTADLFHSAWAVAYFADLGSWDAALVPLLADVDLLALEFNHDVEMQRASRRPTRLIERCLGNEGHLSNEQAAELMRASLRASQSTRLRHVVQLHISRQCNQPSLAERAAVNALDDLGITAQVHTAWQDRPTANLVLDSEAAESEASPVERCA
jgi:phosphoribosyl 1,2-cyclic phosphodiesterase